MKQHIIHPIEPFYDKDSTILILGSFPSVKSREQMFFYGHPQNRFWKVISAVFDADRPETIPDKKAFLKKNHIALWDVIGSCDIEGSSDSSIEKVVANDISVILNQANICGVFVNGKTAEKFYKKYIETQTKIKAICLPSTSPANAAWHEEKLVKTWSEAIGAAFGAERMICELFERKKIGVVEQPITPVSGGFLHRMYRVQAGGKTYAVKHLNPEIMKRPDAMENYKSAEALEKILEDAGIPIVAAMTIDGRKMQTIFENHFYAFPWQEGSITDWNNITPEQCAMAGEIQGRIHAIEQKEIQNNPEFSHIDWSSHIEKAKAQNSEIAGLLEENKDLLDRVQEELNKARTKLPNIECITDEDMDPKNVMWHEGAPIVIDLECLDHGNPASHALQLSLQWAGVTTCDVDPEKIRAFMKGYIAVYDNGFRDFDKIFGLAYTWIEWLDYNIHRSLGQCQDEAERRMAVGEVRNTLNRIRYIHDREEDLKKAYGF